MATRQRGTRRNRKDELVEVSARLFRDRGYDATSMQEIADEVGILKGSLYHYVATKEDLLWMIVEEPLTSLVESAEAIFADTSVPFMERVRRAISAHCERFETYHPHMFVITRENGETLSKKRRSDLVALRDRYEDVWKRAMEEGKKSGDLRADLDVSIAVEAIFGMINWMFRWFRPGGRLTASAVADEFASILQQGIAGEPHATRRKRPSRSMRSRSRAS